MIYLLAQPITFVMMLTSVQFKPVRAVPQAYSGDISIVSRAKRDTFNLSFENTTLLQVPLKTAATTTEPGTKGVSCSFAFHLRAD